MRRTRRTASSRREARKSRRDRFRATLAELTTLAERGVTVSARISDIDTGSALVSIDSHVSHPAGSFGQVLVLIEAAAQIEEGRLHELQTLTKRARDVIVGRGGVWHDLRVAELTLADILVLVGELGDPTASNVLLRQLGIDVVQLRTEKLGLHRTALLDRARQVRGEDDAPTMSVASTLEAAWLMGALHHGSIVSPEVSDRVRAALSSQRYESPIANALGLAADPMHTRSGARFQRATFAGMAPEVLFEAGTFRGQGGGVTFALAAQFDEQHLTERVLVHDSFAHVARDILDYTVSRTQ